METDWLNSRWQAMLDLSATPWFRIGSTDITLLRLLGLIAILVLVWWFAALAERSVRAVIARANPQRGTNPATYAVSRLMRYLVWVIGMLVGLNFIGFDLATLALLGGAIGIGIGLGLQNIFMNFLSGIVLLLEQTLKVGDFVDLQSGVVGTVREIGMRYTRVTTNDNVDVIVPNSEFVNGRVTNWTLSDRRRRIHVPFAVAYGSDKEKVRMAGLAAALSIPGTVGSSGYEPEVWLVGFADSALDFELVVWVDQELMTAPARTHARYLWALESELRRAGVEIPFPQRDLHMRSGTIRVELERNNDRAEPDRNDER